jgi:hypothetical protein
MQFVNEFMEVSRDLEYVSFSLEDVFGPPRRR